MRRRPLGRAVWPLLAVFVLVSSAACGSDDSEGADRAVDQGDPPATAAEATEAPPTEAPSTGTAPASGAPAGESVRERVVIPAPSLAGNLLGDPTEIEVMVQTPASYQASPERRYPVVYYLAGYGEPAAVSSIGSELDDLVEAGEVAEMILVAISGDNALGGSFYVDSPVTGNWASLVVDDVVGAIDGAYRTLPAAASRGIAGFSMGGFGAFDLAMRHPDVFGAVYALSPGVFAPDGLAESQMFADPEVIADVVALQQELWALPAGEAAGSMMAAIGSADVRFSVAYGAAFAPDPDRPPYVRYPYADAAGAPDPEIWAAWEAGYGGIAEEVAAYRDNLLALRGIVIDYGTRDEYEWIPEGCVHLHEQLDAAGVPHRLEQHDGGHGPVGPRAGEIMWPFFGDALVTS